MKAYITVDGGTTNTRLRLIQNEEVQKAIKLSVGARLGFEALKSALRSGICDLLEQSGLCSKDIECIIASGMITSEYGLCNLAHIHTPAGKSELCAAMHRQMFPDISDIPWFFIRGVRSSSDTLDNCDIMRGEETELVGIFEKLQKSALYVLPGSHSKHISVDVDGKILSFRTMMSGELFAAVMQNTILKDAADFDHNTLIEEKLLFGYEYCERHGINEALFKTRILKNIFGASKEDCYSFLLGCVLFGEAKAIQGAKEHTVVIGGQKQFRDALSVILKKYGKKEIITLSDDTVELSTSYGALRIYESLTDNQI